MKRARLKNPYIAVMKDGGLSYGGDQSWAEGKILQKYGCGVIAGTDLILYLGLHKEYCNGREIWEDEEENGIWDAEQYLSLVKRLNRKYFWVIPGMGMPGLFLAWGLNGYFRFNRIPLKASFGVSGRNLMNRIAAMLAHDIPVILAVGPNLSLFRKKYKLDLYQKKGEGFQKATEVSAHYVTVTAVEEQWMKISSWGREYFIHGQEYMDHVKKHGSFFTSNIVYIRKRK